MNESEILISSKIDIDKLADKIADRINIKNAANKTSLDLPSREYITRKEMARRFDITIGTVHNIQKSGKIPCYRFGDRRVLFKVSEVEAYIQDQRYS